MFFRYLTLLLFLSVIHPLWATHNRSGDITYRHLHGNTYEFTITTCTKLSSEVDRPKLEIFYGDGSSDTILRTNEYPDVTTDSKKNIYVGTHTYTGAGTYIIQMQDPNRNSGVLNITDSVDKIFCIQSKLVISPYLGGFNNSIIMEECPCPEHACLYKRWVYNVAAYDPDGDSVSYALIPCKGEDCINMSVPSVYQYPQNVGGGTMTIDPITGTVIWDAPGLIGEYNLAIIIYEYRQGTQIGFVIRDMQLTVQSCNNQPPTIQPINDVCVQSGEYIHKIVSASDPDLTNVLSFDVYGAPYHFATNPAIFTSGTQTITPLAVTLTGTFDWTPDCAAIRPSPYSMVFEVNDNAGSFQLYDIQTMHIQVNGPPVQNLQISPLGNALNLSWAVYGCNNVVKYNIYRTIDFSTVMPDTCCHPNQAQEMGYQLIGSTNDLLDTTYSDHDHLVIGNHYCYIVTAVLDNGAESCVSLQVCSQLRFEIPVLTNVTIDSTSSTTGSDTIRWQHPTQLNAIQYPGPYQYKLYRGIGANTPNQLIFTTSSEAILQNCDTLFHDINLNTEDTAYTYDVELMSNGISAGLSSQAESVFLSMIPNDNQLALSWEINTPWYVDSSQIYRETTQGSGIFNYIRSTSGRNYTDSGLVNGVTYCYKIKTFGHYGLAVIHSPLVNWSQIACGVPWDYTPPCAPSISIEQDCNTGKNTLTWNNPNNSCADDVTHYALYFSSHDDGNFTKIEAIDGSSDTTYFYFNENGLSGCYYVTAFDSIQYNNQSVPSNTVCIENCPPVYVLPNVVTPNGDGQNDLYHPILPIKYVSHVDFTAFNRWGEIVFETNDSMINWDGKESKKGQQVTEGVYFYLCKVYFSTLKGEDSITLQGFFNVIYK